MKRIIISVIIFLICCSGAVSEVLFVSRTVNGYIEEIEIIDGLIGNDDFSKAQSKCAELENSWHTTLRIIDVFLIHDYVDKITISIAQMNSYAKTGSAESYYSVSAEAKKALASIKDSEYPLPENIL